MTSGAIIHKPSTLICNGATDTRRIAQENIGHDAQYAIATPSSGTVIASTEDGRVVTFECSHSEGSQKLRMIDVLIGLGFFVSTYEVIKDHEHLVSPTARADEQYILEKPLVGKGIAVRPVKN